MCRGMSINARQSSSTSHLSAPTSHLWMSCVLRCIGGSTRCSLPISSRSLGAARERNHFSLLSTVSAALALCMAFLAPVISAQDTLTFHVPSEVTLCQPVNFTWTGGIPPYRLDVEQMVKNAPNVMTNQRKADGIETTWVLWTPDFPVGSTLQITVVGSGLSPSAGGFTAVLSSSDSSCLDTTSSVASSPPLTSTPSASGLSTPVDQPSATSSPAIFASSRSGLSKGRSRGSWWPPSASG